MNKLNLRYKIEIIVLILFVCLSSIGFGIWTQIEYEKAYPTQIEKNEMINIATSIANNGVFSKNNNLLLKKIEKYDIDEINFKKYFIKVAKKDDNIEYFIKVYFNTESVIEGYEITPKENIKNEEVIISLLVGGIVAFLFGTLIICVFESFNYERQ